MLYEVVYEIVDVGDHLATLTVYIDETSIGSAEVRAKVLGELIDLVILGKIASVRVGYEFLPTTWTIKSAAVSGALISQIGRFMFVDTSGTEYEKISLPSLDPDLVDPTTQLINPTTEVVAFIQYIMDEGFTTRFGTDIDGTAIEYFVGGGE